MLIQNIMTSPALTVSANDTIASAAKIMLEKHISGLPVVDENDRLVGIVSESDFLRRGELHTEKKRSWWLDLLVSPGKVADEYVHANGRKIEEVMSSPVSTVTPDAQVTAAVKLMEDRNIKRLPVVANGKVVGIVTRSDFLRALVETLPAQAGAVQDEQIEAAILKELGAQSWARNGFIRVSVKDGVATLSGTIFDDRERVAAKVAVENIPGVRSVNDELTWVEPNSGLVMTP